jgi:hypothetical protein
MSKRKYRKGQLIKSLNELVEQEFVYFNNKITHRGWFESWPIRTAKIMIEHNAIREAIKIESEDE